MHTYHKIWFVTAPNQYSRLKFLKSTALYVEMNRILGMSSDITDMRRENCAGSKKSQISDFMRQWANLILAPLMWLLSSIGFIDSQARTPSGLSEINESLLVPFGAAFSIWLPIFVGCIAYGILQVLKTNRTREVFRATGWWTASGFLLICVWSLIAAYSPDNLAQWGTAIVFIPAMLCLVKAMLVITANRKSLDKTERMCVWLPLSLIAGWTSIAVFLNWTPLLMEMMGNIANIVPNIIMLVLALLWAAFIIRKSGGNRAYAFPIIWGLAFLALKQLVTEQAAPAIAVIALIGILILVGAAVFRSKTNDTAELEKTYKYV